MSKRIVELRVYQDNRGIDVTIEFTKPTTIPHYHVYKFTPKRWERLCKMQVDYYLFDGTIGCKTYCTCLSVYTVLEFPAKMTCNNR